MHLLVLSAFRLLGDSRLESASRESQCTFWCSVLSDRQPRKPSASPGGSQCTFWCSVLSDNRTFQFRHVGWYVSMHLLVLSAFRPIDFGRTGNVVSKVSMHLLVLSAFRLNNVPIEILKAVSMHLLVLSAFRRYCLVS